MSISATRQTAVPKRPARLRRGLHALVQFIKTSPWQVKASMLVMGLGQICYGQIIKGLIYLDCLAGPINSLLTADNELAEPIVVEPLPIMRWAPAEMAAGLAIRWPSRRFMAAAATWQTSSGTVRRAATTLMPIPASIPSSWILSPALQRFGNPNKKRVASFLRQPLLHI